MVLKVNLSWKLFGFFCEGYGDNRNHGRCSNSLALPETSKIM